MWISIHLKNMPFCAIVSDNIFLGNFLKIKFGKWIVPVEFHAISGKPLESLVGLACRCPRNSADPPAMAEVILLRSGNLRGTIPTVSFASNGLVAAVDDRPGFS